MSLQREFAHHDIIMALYFQQNPINKNFGLRLWVANTMNSDTVNRIAIANDIEGTSAQGFCIDE
jgi:hypothetical protein